MEALPDLLPLFGPGFPRPIPVLPPPMPPLLGPHWAPFFSSLNLLRVGGSNPEVHQWIQVPETVPQIDSWAGH